MVIVSRASGVSGVYVIFGPAFVTVFGPHHHSVALGTWVNTALLPVRVYSVARQKDKKVENACGPFPW